MQGLKRLLSRWGPSLVIMLGIFALSSRPASELPWFGWADAPIKKAGHMLGYGLLGPAYWRGFKWEKRRAPVAWGIAVLYAVTDELHQAFVPGRHPSALDVLLFDATGAALGIWLRRITSKPLSQLARSNDS